MASSGSGDFRSLLSTFQAATTGGGESTSATTTTTTSMKENDKSDLSLKELTEKLWRLTQLKRSTTVQKTSGITAASQKKKKNQQKQEQPIHLAICLCIVNELPHENIWKRWMEERSSSSGSSGNAAVTAELYLHAKHPDKIQSQWARSKLIGVSHKPNWNDVRVVKAMLSLARTALQDIHVTHVVFGTESCIPICPLEEMALQSNYSYVKHTNECTRFDELNVWNVVQQYVPSQAIYKALPGWCTLCRSHAQAILDLPKTHLHGKELWTAFEECWAPEEVFFPTALSLMGLLLDETINESLTFAEWDERAPNHEDRAHPKVWDDEFRAELVQDLRRQGHLFLRKVKRPMPLRRWEQAVWNKGEQQPPSSRTVGGRAQWKRKRYPDDSQRNHDSDYQQPRRRPYNGGGSYRERGGVYRN